MMDLAWILGALAAMAFFVWREWAAFKWPTQYDTLSMAIWKIATAFPLSIFFMGQFVGILEAHLFWHWCPTGSISTGFLALPAQ